jgi:hypothetical protein
VIAQRKQLGGGAISDGETDAKNASVDGPLKGFSGQYWTKKTAKKPTVGEFGPLFVHFDTF